MSFGTIADDYDRLRPPPPRTAVGWLLPAGCRVAVDLAAGTGLLSRALAGQVARVIAVEPDERMAAVLRARSPGVEVVRGRGEAIPLPDASADGVFVSSAWHWMDPRQATAQIARVLRDGGRFGLIWTGRDRETGWVRDLDEFVRDAVRPAGAGPDDAGPDHTRPRGGRDRQITVPGELFGNIESASFTFSRAMTLDDVVGMLATYSRVITASPAERAEGLARARAGLGQRFGGADEIDVPMRSWCWRADRVARHRRESEPARLV